MRKILLLAAATFVLSIAAKAQIVSSTSSMTTTTRVETESNTRTYVRIGISSNKVVGVYKEGSSKDKEKSDASIGYNLLFGFQKPLGKLGAYYGMEYGLSTRGFKFKGEGEDSNGDDADFKVTAHQIQWSPFNFGWNITAVRDILQIDPHVGFALTMDFFTCEKNGYYFAYYDEYEYDSYRDFYDEKDIDSHSLYDYYFDSYFPLDVKMSLGCGLWFINKINLDFTYQRGFFDMGCWCDGDFGGDGEFLYGSTFMIRVGYAF